MFVGSLFKACVIYIPSHFLVMLTC